MELVDIPFIVGEEYSRKDIYKILNVPPEQQEGNWNTGYNRYKDDWFIFANVNTEGRTGHDYANRIIGNDLEWYGKIGSKITHSSIQSLVHPTGNIYVFTREDNRKPEFRFVGVGTAKEVEDTSPVKILWGFD